MFKEPQPLLQARKVFGDPGRARAVRDGCITRAWVLRVATRRTWVPPRSSRHRGRRTCECGSEGSRFQTRRVCRCQAFPPGRRGLQPPDGYGRVSGRGNGRDGGGGGHRRGCPRGPPQPRRSCLLRSAAPGRPFTHHTSPRQEECPHTSVEGLQATGTLHLIRSRAAGYALAFQTNPLSCPPQTRGPSSCTHPQPQPIRAWPQRDTPLQGGATRKPSAFGDSPRKDSPCAQNAFSRAPRRAQIAGAAGVWADQAR